MSTGLGFEPKKILVFRVGHLGDTLVALPAFWTIRNTYPNAHITLLSNISLESSAYPTPRGVIPPTGLFDSFLSYPTQAGKLTALTGLIKLFFQIRAGKYDTVVYLMPRIRGPHQVSRDLKFFKLAGVKQHIGTKYLIQNHIPAEGIDPASVLEPEYQYLLKCLTEEGMPANFSLHTSTDMLLNDTEREKAERWLSDNIGDVTSKRIVAVAPGSKWTSKQWDEEKFTETLSRLITNKNLFPIIFGGPEDFDKGERILKTLGAGVNSAGKLTIRESGAAMAHCEFYLGNDTGTMHLAAAMGVPCVAIFSSITYEGSWDPFGDRNQILRKRVPCAACHLSVCKFNKECLDTSVDEAYEACLRILDN